MMHYLCLRIRRFMKLTSIELLEMAVAAYEFLSRPTLAKALGLGSHTGADLSRRHNLWRLQRDGLLNRIAHGNEIGWRVTAAGRRRLAELRNVPHLRQRHWDGRWRLVMFDVPEVSRKQRDAFRWWLRMERLGQMQKSVWVSAFPLSTDLEEFLRQAAELNWVLWFESPEKGPVTDVQIAQRVWSLSQLAADYERYTDAFGGKLTALQKGRATDTDLPRWRAEEVAAYEALLRRDPFLPKELLPSQFPGVAADELHVRFTQAVVRAAKAASR
jgi:phenylacetic acid degradation operon negative regulatory protein